VTRRVSIDFMVEFLKTRKHLFLLLLYPVVGLAFAFCEFVVESPRYVVEWPQVDRIIPFVPAMIWPYLFWYVAIFFTFAWLGWRDGKEFTRFAWFIYGGMLSACVIYLLFPNGELLRPATSTLGTGWDYDALRWLYSQDDQNNVNPSIHVINTLAFWIALSRDRILGSRLWFHILLALVSLLVIASTVLVKQHSILDVFGGLAMAGVWYFVLYYRHKPL